MRFVVQQSQSGTGRLGKPAGAFAVGQRYLLIGRPGGAQIAGIAEGTPRPRHVPPAFEDGAKGKMSRRQRAIKIQRPTNGNGSLRITSKGKQQRSV